MLSFNFFAFVVIIVTGVIHVPVSSFLNSRRWIPVRTRVNLNTNINDAVEVDDKFMQNGLEFGCTGCGRCCQSDGEVWFNTDEFHDLVQVLRLPTEDVIDIYIEEVINGWTRLKSKIPPEDSKDGAEQCIFLDKDGEKCSVYNARPVQCRTYPWWPEIISNRNTWWAEAVLPLPQEHFDSSSSSSMSNSNDSRSSSDGSPLLLSESVQPVRPVLDAHEVTGVVRYWSSEEGGCEGISHVDATVVGPDVIHRNHLLYKLYNADFPYTKTGNDEEQLVSSVDVMQRVVRATRQWVDKFVIGYNLCPFAEAVFATDRTRYRTFLGTDRAKILARIKVEVLDLLATDEDTTATTLLMLPFAFPDFRDFYSFSLDLEDIALPAMERSIQRCTNQGSTNNSREEGEEDEDNEFVNEIQLAFFHPTFAWSTGAENEDINAPLNFEKRAPFPTINLLRAARVREYADQDKTTRISNKNVHSLEAVGGEELSSQFNEIILSALS